MSDRRKILAGRRATLVSRIGQQRERLAGGLRGLDWRLRAADRGIVAARRLATNPLVVVLGLAAWLSLRRRPGLRTLLRGAALLAAGRRLGRALDPERLQAPAAGETPADRRERTA